MDRIRIAFPQRALKLHQPIGAWARLLPVLGFLFLAGIFGGWLGYEVAPALISDFRVQQTAQPLANAHVEGRCSSRAAIFHDCDVKLVFRRKGDEVRREVHYLFVDFHTGSYSARVMGDPDHPETMTTDLGLDKLWNRVATLLGMAVIGIGMLAGIVIVMRGNRADARALRRLSGQALQPVPLQFLGWQGNDGWRVAGQDGLQHLWRVPRKAKPLILDAQRGLVLGVTAAGAEKPFPLDDRLRWVDLQPGERAAVLQAAGQQPVPAR